MARQNKLRGRQTFSSQKLWTLTWACSQCFNESFELVYFDLASESNCLSLLFTTSVRRLRGVLLSSSLFESAVLFPVLSWILSAQAKANRESRLRQHQNATSHWKISQIKEMSR